MAISDINKLESTVKKLTLARKTKNALHWTNKTCLIH